MRLITFVQSSKVARLKKLLEDKSLDPPPHLFRVKPISYQKTTLGSVPPGNRSVSSIHKSPTSSSVRPGSLAPSSESDRRDQMCPGASNDLLF